MIKKIVFNSAMAVCLALLASCAGSEHKGDCVEITVDIHRQGKITDFIKSMDGYVFLETNDSSILQRIDKLRLENDTIYIADRDVLQMFGRKDGKWLGKIDRQGRGPGEYYYISDFDVYDSGIYILSGNKIIIYDSDATAKRTIQLDDWFNRLLVQEDGTIWLYSGNSNETRYNYVLIDPSDGKTKSKYDYFSEPRGFGFSDNYPFCGEVSGTIYTSKYFDNIMYSLTSEDYKPSYQFDVNLEHIVTQEELSSLNYKELGDKYRNKESFRQVRYVGKDRQTMFADLYCFLDEGGLMDCLVKTNLKTGEVHSYLVNKAVDPAFPLFDSGDIEGYDGKTVISSIYASWAKEQGKKYGFEDLAAISEYDNPVLVFHTLNY